MTKKLVKSTGHVWVNVLNVDEDRPGFMESLFDGKTVLMFPTRKDALIDAEEWYPATIKKRAVKLKITVELTKKKVSA